MGWIAVFGVSGRVREEWRRRDKASKMGGNEREKKLEREKRNGGVDEREPVGNGRCSAPQSG